MTDGDIPDVVVRQLNDLGFALVERRLGYTFARAAIGVDLRLRLEPLGEDKWRIGVTWRHTVQMGRIPNPMNPMSLSRLGPSADGETIDLSTRQVVRDLARLMADAVLPLVDLPPS